MPVVTITFQLPEERDEYADAYRAAEYACALHDVREILYRADEHDLTSLVDALWAALPDA